MKKKILQSTLGWLDLQIALSSITLKAIYNKALLFITIEALFYYLNKLKTRVVWQ